MVGVMTQRVSPRFGFDRGGGYRLTQAAWRQAASKHHNRRRRGDAWHWVYTLGSPAR